jgi:hypothetical protein
MYAILLLIPVLTLFAGWVTMASGCEKMTVAEHPGCHECAQTCHKASTGKRREKNKDAGACCMDCPLCCLVTIKPFFQLETAPQVTTIEYTVMSDNNLSDYFQQHWKPPCTSLLS